MLYSLNLWIGGAHVGSRGEFFNFFKTPTFEQKLFNLWIKVKNLLFCPKFKKILRSPKIIKIVQNNKNYQNKQKVIKVKANKQKVNAHHNSKPTGLVTTQTVFF